MEKYVKWKNRSCYKTFCKYDKQNLNSISNYQSRFVIFNEKSQYEFHNEPIYISYIPN